MQTLTGRVLAVCIGVLLIAVLVQLIIKLAPTGGNNDGLQVGFLVVGAVAILMGVLFLVAVVFSKIGLSDQKQALGLPDGSIRALIALVLIMMFIIFGIYLYRSVAYGTHTYLGKYDTPSIPHDKQIGSDPLIVQASGTNTNQSDLYLVEHSNDDGKHLAQQLITTVGTLVVAVAGFYFGSSATASGTAAAQPTATGGPPTITGVTPSAEQSGKTMDFTIMGTGLGAATRSVRLVNGGETMLANDITSSQTKIHCRLPIDKAPDTRWDLIVETEDGRTAKLPRAFTILKLGTEVSGKDGVFTAQTAPTSNQQKG